MTPHQASTLIPIQSPPAETSSTPPIQKTTTITSSQRIKTKKQSRRQQHITRLCLCGNETNTNRNKTMNSLSSSSSSSSLLRTKRQRRRRYHHMYNPKMYKTTKNHFFFSLNNILIITLLLCLHPNIHPIHATIQIHLPKHPSSSSPSSSTSTPTTTTNKKYDSQPALFGELFLPNTEYRAHVQLLPHDVYLCGVSNNNNNDDKNKKEKKMTMHYYSETTNVIVDDDDDDDNDDDSTTTTLENKNKNIQQQQQQQNSSSSKIITPKDNVPIALLAKRGKCSFETKAQVAMSLEPPPSSTNFTSVDHNNWDRVVEYVIVYDDFDHGGTLVPMSAASDDDGGGGSGIFVGLLFVSYATGLELIKTIQSQSSASYASGGPYITIDSKAPYFPSHLQYDNSEEWTLITFAGLFIFLACSGCLLISVQSGFIIREGNLIVIGRRDGPTPPGFGNIAGRAVRIPRLLTKDQVLSLPEIEYTVVADNEGDKDNANNRKSRQNKKKQHKRHNAAENAAAAAVEAAQTPFLSSSTFSSTSSMTNYQSISMNSAPNHNIWDTSCAICLEEYTPREMVRMLPCSHVFHTSCIVPWLTQRYPNCPLCKAEVVVDDGSEEGGVERGVHADDGEDGDDIDLEDRSTSSSSSSEWVFDSDNEEEGLFDRSSSMPVANTLNAGESENGNGSRPMRDRIATWSSWMQRSRTSSDGR